MRQRMGRANEAGAIRTAMAYASSCGQPAQARAESGDNVSHENACNNTTDEAMGGHCSSRSADRSGSAPARLVTGA